MNSKEAAEIVELEEFLGSKGLNLVLRKDYGINGDRIIEYAAKDITVQISCDKGIWGILVADPLVLPQKSYDVDLLNDLLDIGGHLETFQVQVVFFKNKWNEVSNLFTGSRKEESHSQLKLLGRARARRLFPGLSGNANL